MTFLSRMMFAVILLESLAICGPATAQAPRRSIPTSSNDNEIARAVRVEAKADAAEYRPLQPIVVSINAKNSSPGDLLRRTGRDAFGRMIILVYHENGRLATLTNYAKTVDDDIELIDSMGSLAYFSSGESRTEQLIANWIYDMTAPGEYRIVVGMPIFKPSKIEEGVKQTFASATAHSDILKVRVAGKPVARELRQPPPETVPKS